MLIETFDESNVKELTSLYIQMFPETDYNEELRIFENILYSKNEVCFLIKDVNQYVGFIHITLRSDYVEGSEQSPTAYVEAIFVKPEFRRKGIAEILINKAEEWALNNNCYTLASDTEILNSASLNFHHKVGFEEVNRIVCFIKKLGI